MQASIAVAWVLAGTLLAQAPTNQTSGAAIRRLTVESVSLPEEDRKRITSQFQESEYLAIGSPPNKDFSPEIQAGIERSLRNLGYYKASVGMPILSLVNEQENIRIVDVTVAVDEGVRYLLGEIRFTGGTLFPRDQIRRLFPIQTGDVFSAAKIGEGMRELEKLYEAKGYAFYPHAVATVTTEDPLRVANVTFDLVEGEPYTFGALTIAWPEPHPGADEALLESWKALQGKPYNRTTLNQWLADNWRNLPAGVDVGRSIKETIHQRSHVVSVRLSFPQDITTVSSPVNRSQ